MSKGFMFAKEGQKNWNITEENKQYCATVKVYIRKIQENKAKPSKTHRSGCKPLK